MAFSKSGISISILHDIKVQEFTTEKNIEYDILIHELNTKLQIISDKQHYTKQLSDKTAILHQINKLNLSRKLNKNNEIDYFIQKGQISCNYFDSTKIYYNTTPSVISNKIKKISPIILVKKPRRITKMVQDSCTQLSFLNKTPSKSTQIGIQLSTLINNESMDIIDPICDDCGGKDFNIDYDNLQTCTNCHSQLTLSPEPININKPESINSKNKTSYDRMGHLTLFLTQLQCKETNKNLNLPLNILKDHFNTLPNTDIEINKLTHISLKSLMKEKGLIEYYANIYSLYAKLKDCFPTAFTKIEIDQIKTWFSMIQQPLSEIKSSSKLKSCSYPYISYRFIEKMMYETTDTDVKSKCKIYLNNIILLKSLSAITIVNNYVWFEICKKLNWTNHMTKSYQDAPLNYLFVNKSNDTNNNDNNDNNDNNNNDNNNNDNNETHKLSNLQYESIVLNTKPTSSSSIENPYSLLSILQNNCL